MGESPKQLLARKLAADESAAAAARVAVQTAKQTEVALLQAPSKWKLRQRTMETADR